MRSHCTRERFRRNRYQHGLSREERDEETICRRRVDIRSKASTSKYVSSIAISFIILRRLFYKIAFRSSFICIIFTVSLDSLKVIRATKEGCDLPVSVKTRIGFNHDVLEEWIPALLECDPAAITIHGRTKKQMSKVPASWEVRLQNNCNIIDIAALCSS